MEQYTDQWYQDEKYVDKSEYKPSWRENSHYRRSTDVTWLIFFTFFIFFWMMVAIFAYNVGDIDKVITPVDSEGRSCGIDEGFEDKPFLLFFDITKCFGIRTKIHCPTRQICVKKCPSTHFSFDNVKSMNFSDLKSHLVCKTGVDVNKIADLREVDELMKAEKCVRRYFESVSVMKRCVPIRPESEWISNMLNKDHIEKIENFMLNFHNLETLIPRVIEDLKLSKNVIVTVTLLSAALAINYILLLRCLAKACVYTTVASVCGFLAFGICTMHKTYHETKKQQDLLIFIGLMLFLVGAAFSLIFLQKRLTLACQIIEEASKAVIDTLSSLIFPIIPWALKFILIVIFLIIWAHLLSIRRSTYRLHMVDGDCVCNPELNYVQDAACDPETFKQYCKATSTNKTCITSACLVKSEAPPLVQYLHFVNFIGLYWSWSFISGLEGMVLAGTFGTWYWTMNKRKLPFFMVTKSYYRTIRYHLGTVSVGSLIITICKVVKFTLWGMHEQLNNTSNHVATRITMYCRGACCLLEKFLKYTNTNSYIMCSIYGKNFCHSAIDSFNLIIRNLMRAWILNNLTWFLMELGKLLIVGVSVFISWWWFNGEKNSSSIDTVQLNYSYLPAGIVGLLSYSITTMFFKVHSAAVETLFLCFLQDSDHNDGSDEKPYFMSCNLRALLNNYD